MKASAFALVCVLAACAQVTPVVSYDDDGAYQHRSKPHVRPPTPLIPPSKDERTKTQSDVPSCVEESGGAVVLAKRNVPCQ